MEKLIYVQGRRYRNIYILKHCLIVVMSNGKFDLFYFAPDFRPIREDICSLLILELLHKDSEKYHPPRYLIDREDLEIIKKIIYKNYQLDINTNLIDSSITSLYKNNLLKLIQNSYLALTEKGTEFVINTRLRAEEIRNAALDEILSQINKPKSIELSQTFDQIVSTICTENAEREYDNFFFDYYYKDNNTLKINSNKLIKDLENKFPNINSEFINIFSVTANNEKSIVRKYLLILSYSLLSKFVINKNIYDKFSQEYSNKIIILDTNLIVSVLFHFDYYHAPVLQLLKQLTNKRVTLVISSETKRELDNLMQRCEEICELVNHSSYYRSFDRIKKNISLSPVLSFFYERWGNWNDFEKAFKKRYEKMINIHNIIDETKTVDKINLDGEYNALMESFLSKIKREMSANKIKVKEDERLKHDLHLFRMVSELRKSDKDKTFTPKYWIWTWDNDFDFYQKEAISWNILKDRCTIIGKSMSRFIDPLDIDCTQADLEINLERSELASKRSYEEILSKLYSEFEKLYLEFGQNKYKLYDLTIPINKCGAFRGGRLPFIQKYDIPYRPHTASSIFFSIHTTTHLDLPWGLDWRFVERKKIEDQISTIENSNQTDGKNIRFIYNILKNVNKLIEMGEKYKHELIGDFSKPTVKECIVLDFTDLSNKFEAFLEDFDDFTIDPKYLKTNLAPEEFETLHKLLSISEEKILEKVSKEDILNKIVLFKTGWDYYYPFYSQLGQSMWEAWYSYLTYPFLDLSGVQCLYDNGAIGVASDTPCLEDPLYYLEPVSQFVQKYIREVYKKGLFENLPVFRPLHVSFLSNSKYVIENLTNTESIKSEKGYLWIDPMTFGSDDGIPLKVYFIPNKE